MLENCIMISSPSKMIMITLRRMRLAAHIACVGAKGNVNRVLGGKLERKRPLRRFGHRWEDNNKFVLTERGWGGIDWILPRQHRDYRRALVNTVMNLRVP
jgi:hypothetical protein